jgi:hypothetical protein
MRKLKGKTVEKVLSQIGSWQKEIVERLRVMVKKTLPQVEEKEKWGK